MSKEQKKQIYQMLSALFATLSKGEQVEECIRQVMTTHPGFNPFALFKAISHKSSVIKKEHIRLFLQQNQVLVTNDEITALFSSSNGKKSWKYLDFLEILYPYNSAALRQITNSHLKGYKQLEKQTPHQSSLASFLMLLNHKISLLRKLETQRQDGALTIPKKKIKKILFSLKTVGEKPANHCQNDASVITSLELRYFIKSQSELSDCHFLHLSRRLRMKNGSFSIQSLQKFIQPKKFEAKKHKKQPNQDYQKQVEAEQVFDQDEYRAKIKEDMSQKLNLYESPSRISISKSKSQNNTATKTPLPLPTPQKQIISQKIQYRQPSGYGRLKANHFKNKSPKQRFLKFIQIFVPAARQIEEYKVKLFQQNADFLGLFKMIDRTQRGVATAEDLHQFYLKYNGENIFAAKDFHLIIQRYGQSQEPWLSFSQFCDMVRSEDKSAYRKDKSQITLSASELIVKILEISLRVQWEILKIRSSFSQVESRELFSLISQQQKGYFHYQELKRFLCCEGVSLSLHDLMAILKRFDKGRNGVVVQQQFLAYFAQSHHF